VPGTSARLVIGWEPGSRGHARTGPRAEGVSQRPESMTMRLSLLYRAARIVSGAATGSFATFADHSLRLLSANPVSTGAYG